MRQVQEKVLERNNKRHRTSVDQEKAFYRVPQDAVYWSLRENAFYRVLQDVVYWSLRENEATENGTTRDSACMTTQRLW